MPHGIDRSVDTDHLTPHVEQGAAGVTWVDGSIGLNEIIVRAGTDDASLGAHDPGGHGVAQAKRVPDGNDPVTDVQVIGVTHGRDGERLCGVDLQHRQVCFGISSHDPRCVLLLVGQGDGHLLGAFHHMVVRHDVAVTADDDSRPRPLGAKVLRELWHLLEKSFEELPEGSFWTLGPSKGRNFLNLGYLNIDDGRSQFIRQVGKGAGIGRRVPCLGFDGEALKV